MANYTSQQLTDLRAAIAAGATSVSFEGRTVTYRSLGEMRELARIMEQDLGTVSATTATTRRYSLTDFSRS